MKDFKKLLEVLDIIFNNQTLLTQAFIHRSYLNESKKEVQSNERLEFLGDSIISFLVSDFLYRNYPIYPEGHLTNLRSSMVKTLTLADIAKKLTLGEYLRLSKGEEDTGGRSNPSLLADTFESLIGAIYLDQGLTSVTKVLKKLLFPLIDKILENKTYKDAKSIFQELVQVKNKISPQYKVLQEKGPDHAKIFTVGVFVNNSLWGSGKGKSKQEAEQIAALEALEKWNKS